MNPRSRDSSALGDDPRRHLAGAGRVCERRPKYSDQTLSRIGITRRRPDLQPGCGAQDIEDPPGRNSILSPLRDPSKEPKRVCRVDVQRDPKEERYRPTLADLIMLHVFSRGEYVDRLWVGVDDPKREPVLERLRAALVLIKTYDPLRYHRLTRDLKRIWATL
jgi:hypothetical protein